MSVSLCQEEEKIAEKLHTPAQELEFWNITFRMYTRRKKSNDNCYEDYF